MPKFVVKKKKVIDKRRLISIDPGTNGTGYAVWSSLCKEVEFPLESNTIKFNHEDWIKRMSGTCSNLAAIARSWGCKVLAIELPTFMEGGKGMIAARDGDLVKLSAATGMIIHTLLPFVDDVLLITPNQWKGNMPKSVSTPRILERFSGEWKPTSKYDHEIDAVGIGLHAKGCF